jgi:RNA polymerase sigma-32 factor
MAEKPRQTSAATRAPRPGGRVSKTKPAAPPTPHNAEAADAQESEEPSPDVVVEEETAALDFDPAADAFAEVEELEAAPVRAIVPASARAITPASRSSAIGPTDLLQRYMADVSRYPLLSREDELSLARHYKETQDPKLAYKMVTANLRLVVKIAWEYRRAAFNLLDLIQEGNVGLMQGVKKFDPERGVKLSSYTAWWIRAYIIRHLMDNWRMVKLGTTQAQRKIFFNLRKEKEKLAAQGFEPEPKLLAERLNVSEQDVVEMDQRLGNDEFSLDAPLSDDSTTSYADRLTQGGQAIDDRLADKEIGESFHGHLQEFAKGLVDKERYIFEHRLTADEPMTLQEVGNHYGISRERARQIEARLTGKLRAYMKEHLPDFEQLSFQPRDE